MAEVTSPRGEDKKVTADMLDKVRALRPALSRDVRPRSPALSCDRALPASRDVRTALLRLGACQQADC